MPSNDGGSDSGDGCTRRALLERAGRATVGGIAAGSVLAGEAAASKGPCPAPHEYWADAEWPDTIDDPFALGGRELSVEEWKALLRADPGADKAHVLVKRLLATILNFHYRWPTDPDCTDKPLDALDGRSVTEVKGRAYDWLNWSRFDTGEPQPYWLVHYRWRYLDGRPIVAALERFNRNGFAALDCGCAEETDTLTAPPEPSGDRPVPPVADGGPMDYRPWYHP